MDSISKTPVDRATAQLILTEALGDGVLVEFEELTEGWFNAAYALTLEDGRRLVLKVAPPPEVDVLAYERDIVHAEIEALRLIRSATEAPVPEVLAVDDRCTLVPSPCFLMTHQPGISLNGFPGDREAVDRDLGRHLRAINAIRGTDFGGLAPSAARFDSWSAAFGALLESVLADGEQAGIELPYDAVRDVLADAGDALDEVTEPRLVYWDLWDGNVLLDQTTHELTGMLDLERAMWGDPLMEMQFGPYGESPATSEAYGPMVFDGPGSARRRALYTLHLHLVMSIEGAYRQYPEDPLGEWARTQLADDLAAGRG